MTVTVATRMAGLSVIEQSLEEVIRSVIGPVYGGGGTVSLDIPADAEVGDKIMAFMSFDSGMTDTEPTTDGSGLYTGDGLTYIDGYSSQAENRFSHVPPVSASTLFRIDRNVYEGDPGTSVDIDFVHVSSNIGWFPTMRRAYTGSWTLVGYILKVGLWGADEGYGDDAAYEETTWNDPTTYQYYPTGDFLLGRRPRIVFFAATSQGGGTYALTEYSATKLHEGGNLTVWGKVYTDPDRDLSYVRFNPSADYFLCGIF